jgi:predicted solute-binding protein
VVLTEHDPGLSPEKSAKSTLCARAHARTLATRHHPASSSSIYSVSIFYHEKEEEKEIKVAVDRSPSSSRTCLDDAALLLLSRALVGMREAARAAWVAISRCRMPDADAKAAARRN